jgi:hypothetical protein
MAEILTTLALRPGMRVIDRDAPATGEHVVAGVTHPAAGTWDVAFADTTAHAVVGARHTWLDVTA